MIRLVSAKIQDESFIRLIRKALKAGYFEFRQFQHSVVGTPQGSIISPILSNIYMNELDKFVENLRSNFDKGLRATENPEYTSRKRAKAKAIDINEKRRIHREMLSLPSKSPIDQKFKRLVYVRYADD